MAAGAIVGGAGAWVFASPILRAAATAWVVDEQPDRAAAIVILGGGLNFRPAAAARLYHDGWAPLVLVPRVEPSAPEQMGLAPSEGRLTIGILEKLGVPPQAIESYGRAVTSTRDEAEAAKAWAQGKAVDRLLIPTDPMHTRRVNWIFGKALPSIDIRVIRVSTQEYDSDSWRQPEKGLATFQSEALKSLYYFARY